MGIVIPRYTRGEEIAHSLTHALGIILSIAGLAVLTSLASVFENVWHIVSCSIFGVTLILLYSVSTLYHSIPLPRVKAILRVWDHSTIFLLIAGTYTPFTLVYLRGPWGWSLIGGCMELGSPWHCLSKLSDPPESSVDCNALHFDGMGNCGGYQTNVDLRGFRGVLILLLAGGLAYTLGSVFCVWRRLPYHHAIWHVFVLAGSIFHFFAVLF